MVYYAMLYPYLSYGINSKVLMMVYYAMLYPYLSYGVLLWGSCYKTYLYEIEVLQKKVIRAITNRSYNMLTLMIFSKYITYSQTK